jgi:hypothetical protein
LAILFGDEFIDGIAGCYGKQNVKKIMHDKNNSFYLQYRKNEHTVELFYPINICTLLPQNILDTYNDKYTITYNDFYAHLQFLLAEMNRELQDLPSLVAVEAARLITVVCNKCFDTYKVDIEAYTPDYDWNKLLQYQQSKDDEIVKTLLQLRCTLLQKKTEKYASQYESWAYMIRSMQIYDDIQDVALDKYYQMNFVGYFAKNFFIQEWNWLTDNARTITTITGIELHCLIAVNMPFSVMLCLQYNKNISHKNLSWVQLKIQSYLWRKNWMGIHNPLLPPTDAASVDIMALQQKLFFYQQDLLTEQMLYAYITDVALLEERWRKILFSIAGKKESYFLKNCYTIYPDYKKAVLAKKLLAHHNGVD